jgi:hypothetical protein
MKRRDVSILNFGALASLMLKAQKSAYQTFFYINFTLNLRREN